MYRTRNTDQNSTKGTILMFTPRKIRAGAVSLVAGAMALGIILSGCSAPAATVAGSPSTSTPTPTASLVPVTEEVQAAAWTATAPNCAYLLSSTEPAKFATYAQWKDYDEKKAQCKNVGSLNPDGTTATTVTLDDDTDEPLTSADTTSNPQTPATFQAVRDTCVQMLYWSDLYDCVIKSKAQWYIDAVNARAPNTGFDWYDVQKWALDPELKGVTQVNIQVYGDHYTDEEARAIAAELVGVSLANSLEIVRHPAGLLINTAKYPKGEVYNFNDPRTMVRVSLNPIGYTTEIGEDEYGKPTRIETPFLIKGADSGVFIDCLNIWWLAVWVWTCTTFICLPPPPVNCTNPLICIGKDPRWSPPVIPGVTYSYVPGRGFVPGPTPSGGSTGNVSGHDSGDDPVGPVACTTDCPVVQGDGGTKDDPVLVPIPVPTDIPG